MTSTRTSLLLAPTGFRTSSAPRIKSRSLRIIVPGYGQPYLAPPILEIKPGTPIDPLQAPGILTRS